MKHLKLIGLAAVAVMALTAFFGAGTASATELYKYTTPSANDTLGVGTTLSATITEGTSVTIEDTEEDLLVDTCTSMAVHGTIDTAGGVAAHPSGSIGALSFGNCSHTTDILSKGSLEVRHIAGTTNGTVISKGAQVTFQSTIFGISCTANTGAGTALGTLTGAKSSTGNATMDINAIMPIGFFCGGDARWTGSLIVSSPTGLTVEEGQGGNH